MSRTRAAMAAALLYAAAALAPLHAAQNLPPEVQAALQRARVPASALSVVVQEAGSGRPVLHWRQHEPVNPASLAKLLTTAAALDRLGPAWRWRTPVWLDGPLRDGVLEGSLVIQGSGDPTLVLERVWLLLRRVQALGVREIRGDIVLDGSAFAVPEADPGDFDGEPLRPYNVRPAALLLNFRSVLYSFVPDAAAGVARVVAEPPLAATVVDASVPLVAGPCGDWRAALKASFEAGRTRFAGSYATACGEQTWPVADPQPATYDARLVEALWREMGGRLHGRARAGPAPAQARPAFEWLSPPLAEVVRDINKFSNNVMAQQLFLTLALQAAPQQPATEDAARMLLTDWVAERAAAPAPTDSRAETPLDPTAAGGGLVVDNGSGLSRRTRISAQQLARLLLVAYDSPVMSEFMSSLPISGLDGTLRRSRATPGRAHLKTGSLRDVNGVAGYVLSDSGRRYVLVAIVNHAQAGAARPALDALVQWTLRDAPRRGPDIR
ncbi:MAG TPA: D-alanyl-D-alanine carboxypeptidase/D-alanyl-D-alanine-endopeptidase [Rubrivivax sp.]|nr:D-alanyl-D-alanine carboxypeptidase/D-alanyl-D-alanine-endopeptidase [Rubrivivax sp.]